MFYIICNSADRAQFWAMKRREHMNTLDKVKIQELREKVKGDQKKASLGKRNIRKMVCSYTR